ncbi:hypothetical protein P3T27_001318 [Kitasatospora sp. MAA19]|uniref:hypothetical protein n=1 Tax=Kitasatospora sp. MAA19 TaxID=3035090 RepID=UPI002475759A|nr:hypothetical protein [Kitasatospora sp. MAA19]MDH6704615.1 hypothetical protein [Kitasatospora sp. MAA19]
MRAVRLASTVVTATVLLGAATACGSKGAADATSGGAKGGDAVAAAMGGDPRTALAAAALVMQKAGNGKVTMIAPDGSTHTAGNGDADWKDPSRTAVDLTGEVETKKIRFRVIGTDGYLGGGDTEAAAMGGKHWLKLPASNELGDGVLLMSQLVNPVVQLTLAAQGGKPVKVGQESLDGVQVTHLRAVEDASAMVAGMPALSADQRAAVQKSLDDDGKTLTVDFWLNGRQELVQYQEYGDKNGEHDAVTVKYSDLGKAARIEAPAATDLGSDADILKLLG